MTANETNPKSNKWIWYGLGGAALFCLCAVVVAGFVFSRVGQRVQQGMKTDPEGAAEAAHAIVDYELPPGYQEQMAMDLLIYSVVMIGPDSPSESDPLIMLAQFNQSNIDRQEMEQQMRRSFEQQSGRRGADMQLVKVEKKTIRGEEVEVTTYEGTDENGIVVRQLITSFPGKKGIAVLIIMGSTQSWDQSAMDAFIESIH
jgi:hypothetical protein